jgi:hypothetical protein
MLAAELTTAYGTPVYMIACESGQTVVPCTNFVCPCAQSRRLLQVATTDFKVIYQGEPRSLNAEQLTVILRHLLPSSLVQDAIAVSLPTNVIAWDPALIAWAPPSVSGGSSITPAVVAVVLFIVALLGAGAAYACLGPNQQQRMTLNIKI